MRRKKLIMLLLAVGVIGSMIFTGCAQGLEARVQTLEDIEAIRELKCMYAYYADEENVDSILSLFVDDAVCDFGPFGVHEGKEQIRTLFVGLFEGSSFTMHEMHNHVVAVTGKTATGEAYFEVPATMEPGHMAVWIGGKYVDDYVKVDGEWKFKKVTIFWYYLTPYEDGWAETPMLGQ